MATNACIHPHSTNLHIHTQLFWLEKNLYLHEQSNRFYSASAYFVCKVPSFSYSCPRPPALHIY